MPAGKKRLASLVFDERALGTVSDWCVVGLTEKFFKSHYAVPWRKPATPRAAVWSPPFQARPHANPGSS